MISVIIPKYDDSANIRSCLNSIKRQTFGDIEILVVNDNCDEELINEFNLIQVSKESAECCGLNEAMAQAKGEYIYFCSASSVLSPNTLSELMNVSSDCMAYADVYVTHKGNFVKQEQILSCYGKIFNKSIIDNIGLRFDGNSAITECIFVATYIGKFKHFYKNTEISIYDSKYTQVCDSDDISPDMKYWKKCFHNINNSSPEVNGIVSRALSEIIKKNMICSEELAKAVRETSPLNYLLNYVCFAPILKLIWEKVVNDNDADAYERFKEYIVEFEDEDVLELLLKVCGLKTDYYKYIKNNNINQCLFFIEECERISYEKNELTQAVKTIMTSQSSGLCKIGTEWHYYSNGSLDKTFRGMVKNGDKWWYVANGQVDFEYVGLFQKGSDWYYITDGTINSGYTGIVRNENGILMYVADGIIDRDFVGLVKFNNEVRYVSGGFVDSDYTGLVQKDDKLWYVNKGKVDYGYAGLIREGDDWYYIKDGTIHSGYTGIAMNEGGIWIYLTNGKSDRNFVGLIKTPGGLRYISNGVIDRDFAGLAKTSDGKYVYIQNGRINNTFIGLSRNSEGLWYVENGEINLSFNGFAKSELGWCEVVNGKAKPETIVDVFEILREDPPDPVQVSIGYYSNGQLGLKTIIKSIGAWSKYKFKR